MVASINAAVISPHLLHLVFATASLTLFWHDIYYYLPSQYILCVCRFRCHQRLKTTRITTITLTTIYIQEKCWEADWMYTFASNGIHNYDKILNLYFLRKALNLNIIFLFLICLWFCEIYFNVIYCNRPESIGDMIKS